MSIQIIMYSTNFCTPCKLIKPKFQQLALNYLTYEFIIIDPQEKYSADVFAIPLFKIIKDNKLIFKEIGVDGFNKLSHYIKTI